MDIRVAGPDDAPILLDAVALAVAWLPGRTVPSREQVLAEPALAHYVRGWAEARDLGFVAWEDGLPVGAAWLRSLPASDPGYGFVVEGVPELSMGIAPDYRGRGVGAALLDALLGAADAAGVPGVSLSVEDGNDVARYLYLSRDFTDVGRSGTSDLMLRSHPGGPERRVPPNR